MLHLVRQLLQKANDPAQYSKLVYRQAEALFGNGACQPLLSYTDHFEYQVEDEHQRVRVLIRKKEKQLEVITESFSHWYNRFALAALLQLEEELKSRQQLDQQPLPGIRYSQKGMMQRVLHERRERSEKARYQIELADNIYGEHVVINEKGQRYTVFLRDFETKTGYSDSIDWRTNKLGTTKHIMFGFRFLKEHPDIFSRLNKTFPFVEVYPDPLHDYRITWHFPHELSTEISGLLGKYFGTETHLPDSKLTVFLNFVREAEKYPLINIRPEVLQRIEEAFNERMMGELAEQHDLSTLRLKQPLFPYQAEGVRFATFRKAALLADEIGLGKSVQAIATAVAKKEVFGFSKVLIVCPASLKQQWAEEIAKFTHEPFEVVEGTPEQRKKHYQADAFFWVAHYEQLLHDGEVLNQFQPDFVMLDEAQRIRNFETKTFDAVNRLPRKHALILTGTPVETSLRDLYTLVLFLDPNLLTPLWEFSYRHFLFDQNDPEKVVGYYHLNELKERLSPILLRREKSDVSVQLPDWQEVTVPVTLTEKQHAFLRQFSDELKRLQNHKMLSGFERQKTLLLLNKMRMVCNSPLLIDPEPALSPKLEELRYLLTEKLQLAAQKRKVIIFSEWVKMNRLVAKLLREEGIGFVELSGETPIGQRSDLVHTFENDADCLVFLSSETGEEGLNLQAADTIINMEQPWNRARLQQRLGVIDRIGQQHQRLTMIHLIAKNSIEEGIATGQLYFKEKQLEGLFSVDQDAIDLTQSGNHSFQQLIRKAANLKIEPLEAEDSELPILPPEQPFVSDQGTLAFSEDSDHWKDLIKKGLAMLQTLQQFEEKPAVTFPSLEEIEVSEKEGRVVISFPASNKR